MVRSSSFNTWRTLHEETYSSIDENDWSFASFSDEVVVWPHVALCGMLIGKDSFEHIGNKRFRQLIDVNIQSYHQADSRRAKTGIVTKIFKQIQMNASEPSGGFVKKVS